MHPPALHLIESGLTPQDNSRGGKAHGRPQMAPPTLRPRSTTAQLSPLEAVFSLAHSATLPCQVSKKSMNQSYNFDEVGYILRHRRIDRYPFFVGMVHEPRCECANPALLIAKRIPFLLGHS